MQIRKIVCYEISIPLKFRFSQSNNPSSTTSSSIIIELIAENGVSGFGECCPRSYVTGENAASVKKDISEIQQKVFSSSCSTVTSLQGVLNELQDMGIGNSTLCAVELAYLDLLSRTSGQKLPEMLGLKFVEPLLYSLVLPLLTPSHLASLLKKISFFNPPSIKLKVDADLDCSLENISLIRSTFGAGTQIRLDVNEGWALEEAKHFIPTYLDNEIYSFEQILAPDDHDGMRILTREFGSSARIMIDEALVDLESAQTLIQNKIGNHFNLKVSKLGGLFKTVETYTLAMENGIPCQLGAHFGETSILTAAGIIVAGIAGGLSAMEGALGTLLLENDVVSNPIQQDFSGSVDPRNTFQQPGLTGDIDEQLLEYYGTQKTEFAVGSGLV